MKIIKVITGFMWIFATMLLCVIDTDYTPISNILVLLFVWAIIGLVTSKIDYPNEHPY